MGESTWTWELSADYGRNDTDVRTEGEFRADRLKLALGPSGLDVSGDIVCGKPDAETGLVPPQNAIPGCVPMNLFGGQGPDGTGTITQAMLDYATTTLTDRGYNEQQLYELIFRGDWGAIQDRAIKWAVGVTHRNEKAAARLDPAKLEGTAGNAPTNLDHGGEFRTNEAYAESVVPLLSGLPAAESLNLTGGLRYSDFSSFGSVTTYQAGLMYRPVQSITLRGSYGTVFRAPPIAALYTSNLNAITFFVDPCGNSPTPEQQVHCAAAGVPGGSYVQPENDPTLVVLGGNRDLQPEKGDSVSGGITLAPDWADGLELSIDYWRTSLDDVIVIDPGGQVYLDACADSGVPDACARIRRGPDGSLISVDKRHANGASLVASGYDLDLGYTRPWLGGEFSTRLFASYLEQYDYVPAKGAATLDVAGTEQFPFGALPHWRGLGFLQYSHGDWTGSYQVQYIGTMRECGEDNDPTVFSGCRTIDDRWYQDLRLQYRFVVGPTLTFAISNLGNEDPPRVNFDSSGANTDSAAYPLLGRTYFLQLSYRIE